MPFCQCWMLHILLSDLQSFPLRPVCNAKSLLGSPIHIKYSNTSYIPVGEPSTETLSSGHHNYASHTCCIQAYSAAALGFRRLLSCGQRVRLEWTMLCCFPLCSNNAFRLSCEEFINSRHSCGSCLIHQAIYIVAEHKVIFLFEERHQLLMTAKRRNSDFFSRRFRCLSLDPSHSALFLDSSRSLIRPWETWFSRNRRLRRTRGQLAFVLVV